MEFTLEHDDGLGLETLAQADIVLAGISRTSKTPTSVYLAQMGYRAANVSLAMGVPPPPELLAMPSNKVVGLLIYPETLAEIRTRRNRGWKMGDTAYNDPAMIAEELTCSRRLFQKQRGPSSTSPTGPSKKPPPASSKSSPSPPRAADSTNKQDNPPREA